MLGENNHDGHNAVTSNKLIILFILCTFALLCAFKVISLLVTSRKRKQDISTKDFLVGKITLGPADLCFPVRYASAAHFSNPLTFLPWEAQGALVLNDDHFCYFGKASNGKEQQLKFDRNNCLLIYIEKKPLRDSGLSWFSLEDEDGALHYFCTQRKIPNFTKTFGTTALYEKMTERYSNL